MAKRVSRKVVTESQDNAIDNTNTDLNLIKLIIKKQNEMKRRNDYIRNAKCIRCESHLIIKECHDEFILMECVNTLCKKQQIIKYEDIR